MWPSKCALCAFCPAGHLHQHHYTSVYIQTVFGCVSIEMITAAGHVLSLQLDCFHNRILNAAPLKAVVLTCSWHVSIFSLLSLTASHGHRVTQGWALALPEGQITHTSVTTPASSSPRSSQEELQQRMDAWGQSLRHRFLLLKSFQTAQGKCFEKLACLKNTSEQKSPLRGWRR